MTILHSFTQASDGGVPLAGLVQGSDGNFYGTNILGGSSNDGTVFRITPAGVLTTLYSFTGISDGANPYAGVIQGSDGNFYGTAFDAGSSGIGTVFRLTPAGAFTTLYTFTGGEAGGNPRAGLLQGSDGNFYGTCTAYGASGYGTVFRITPTGALTTLHQFTGASDGGTPYAGLIQASDGNFYGTTYSGGVGGYGTVFQITPAGALTTLASFTGGANGGNPVGGVIQGSDGNFYGTTSQANGAGGTSGVSAVAASDAGTVFRLTPAGVLTTLVNFNGGSTGAYPRAGLIQGSDGNFYGTTVAYGTGYAGTVFRVTPAGALTTLVSFTGAPAAGNPQDSLIQGSDGNFYGTTSGGGTSGDGTVFQMSLGGNAAPPAGGVSPAFNPGAGADGTVKAIVIQPNGDAIIAGSFTTYQGVSSPTIARVLPSGALDPTFDSGMGADAPINALLLLSNGQIIIGGDFDSYNGTAINGLARLNANGSLDTTFNANLSGSGGTSAAAAGGPIARGTNPQGFVSSVAAGPNGTLVVGGAFQQVASVLAEAVARLNSDGSLDTTFSTANPPNGSVNVTLTQPDSRSLIGGAFTMIGSTPASGIARLNTDGTLDTTFNAGAGARGGAVTTLGLQPDGGVVLGGNFTSVNNMPLARIARVESNGAVDSTFNPGSGANATVSSVLIQPTGKVLVGGAFTQIADVLANAVARLNNDGTYDASFNAGTGAQGGPVDALAETAGGSDVLMGGDFSMVSDTPLSRVALLGGGEPPFFEGDVSVGGGYYYLAFPNGNFFGFYDNDFYPAIYHADLGFEYFIDANDGVGGAYLYDFASTHFFYSSPVFPFPYLYDFSLSAFLYYDPATNNPGHYTTNPRYFSNLTTGQIITQ